LNFDEKFEKLKFCSHQIHHFDPEPFYVEHFLKEYLETVIEIYRGILEEADRDFGLFVKKVMTKENFNEKAMEKGDGKALEFLEWYSKKHEILHKPAIPNLIGNLIKLKSKKFPKCKIMLTSKNRYSNDPTQEVIIGLNNGKFRSKLDLEIIIKRQLPIFLQIINKKRDENNEPKVSKNEVVPRAFLDYGGKKVEIVYAVEVYLEFLSKFKEDSLKKIHELTIWK